MEVNVNVRERILKPVGEVFAAFIEPEKMTNFFISGASGPMKAGEEVLWEFADVGAKMKVKVLEVEDNRKIVWEWPATGEATRVTLQFTADAPDITVLTINEARFPLDGSGVKRAMGQTAGWVYTLCCLKAYLQFAVNLRAGLNKRLTDV